ncbi:MAG: hypothetical protein GWO24_12270, partial [Akkermansiaceae bacterium]|nr:hypothetical protein [Akkermansiaceae bacterium]
MKRKGGSFLLWGSLLVSPIAGARDYDHQRLLYRLGEDGTEIPVETAADWRIRRAAILMGMEAAMGTLPERGQLPAFDLEVLEVVKAEGFVRQTVRFVAEEGDRVPAYLYLPGAGDPNAGVPRRAAILALHPTSPLGKGVVDGQSERPNRAYARELAERGYVVLAPDYPPFGDYKGYDFEKDRYA